MNKPWALVRLLGVCLVASCAPLGEDAIRQLAQESPSIRPLAESLAEADGGRVSSLDNEHFLAEVSGRTLSREQFVSTLSTHCQSAHGGSLKTDRDTFRLAREDIRDYQLETIAGRNGPITAYLGDALSRTLNSDINRSVRELDRMASDKRDTELHRQATLVCAGYGNNGLLDIHYLVNYLTEDGDGGGDVLWAVATRSAFADDLKRQREMAETAAGRAMSEDRDAVALYRGGANRGDLALEASLSRPGSYGYEFRMEIMLVNNGLEHAAVDPIPGAFRAADGNLWSADHDGYINKGDNNCRRLGQREVQVPAGGRCHARFWMTINGFDMPNMLLESRLLGQDVEFAPRTRYQERLTER